MPSMNTNTQDGNIMLFKQTSSNSNHFKYSGQSQLSIHESYFVNERLGATQNNKNSSKNKNIQELEQNSKAKSQIIKVSKA